jgi:hypothetical protein
LKFFSPHEFDERSGNFTGVYGNFSISIDGKVGKQFIYTFLLDEVSKSV